MGWGEPHGQPDATVADHLTAALHHLDTAVRLVPADADIRTVVAEVESTNLAGRGQR